MSFSQDVRYAFRMLARRPGFSAVVIFTLALGIGANTAVFTLVNAVLFRSLPFDHAERILYLSTRSLAGKCNDCGTSYPDFRDWRRQSHSFEEVAAFSVDGLNLAGGTGAPQRYRAGRLSANAFHVLRQAPVLGRDFAPGEDLPGANPVLILGYAVWKDRYGADPSVIGRTVRVNEIPTTIVGVMPEGMKFPMNEELWIPLVPKEQDEKRDNRWLSVFGRLRDGASLADARAEMSLISARLQKSYASTNAGYEAALRTFNERFNGGQIRVVFLALLGAVGFVLLIACANVANLLLARSLEREREVSIRAALGAGRWRVVRQLLVESVLLGMLGGLAGMVLAYAGVRWFDGAVANTGKPYWIQFHMDPVVFAYLAAVCVGTGILFGIVPALHVSRVNVNETLKEGGRGQTGGGRLRILSAALVVGQLALAVVLLAGAGLMIRSFLKLYGMNESFDPEHILTFRLNLPDARYKSDDDLRRFDDQLRTRLSSLPGVESLALTSHLPMHGYIGFHFELEGDAPQPAEKQRSVLGLVVSPGYFETIHRPVLQGRAFNESDGLGGRQVVIVNHRFAGQHWPGREPLGRRLHVTENGRQLWLTVVGVSPDIRQANPAQREYDPMIYVPGRVMPSRWPAVMAYTRVAPESLIAGVRAEILKLDPDLPIIEPMSLHDLYVRQRWPYRVFGTLFTVFALIALALASVGIYAVMAHSVIRRRQEFGLRMALGAPTRSILLLALRRGLRDLAVGLAIGVAGAFAVTRVLRSLLVEITPGDPLTFCAIALLLGAVGALACWIPARRATVIDPVVALRYE